MGRRPSSRLIPIRLNEPDYEKLAAMARAHGLRPAVMARLLLSEALGRPNLRFDPSDDGQRPVDSQAPTRYYILSEDDLAAIRRMWEESALRVSRAVWERARQVSPEQAEIYAQAPARG